jgi:hypothetical protein
MAWDEDHYKYHCSDGIHNSFWATVIESPQWKEWEKEVAHRMKVGKRDERGNWLGEGIWDIDECRELGEISPEHFQDFLAWISRGKKIK